jgi:DNA-directed RNA polymerase subunit K/omega
MDRLKQSRGAEIDTDLCVKNCNGNRYQLVIMASARAREIARQHRESENPAHIYPVVKALLEFQTGEITLDSARKIK